MAVSGAALFLIVGFLAWLARGAEAEFVVPILVGVVACLLAGAGLFAAHLLYLTPRNLCAAKQRQLDAERREFAAAFVQEKQSAQLAVGERDVLQSKLEERPLRPLELRQEIDQLIAEGAALLASMESTMIGEAELWFDDVERFARRHLNKKQYDLLHEAPSAGPAAGQVQLHRAQPRRCTHPPRRSLLRRRAVVVRVNARDLKDVRLEGNRR